MYRIFYLFFFLAIANGSALNAQSNQKQITALNNYVDFTNDCIHGLSIVHLMLQNFNNEVNKYVDDKDGNYVFKNSDFGRNIYDDISYFEHRQLTPSDLFTKTIRESSSLRPNESNALNATITQMFDIAKALNELRFETDAQLSQGDADNLETLGNVYDQLETGVEQFNKYYQLRNKLHKQLGAIYQLYQGQIPASSSYKLKKSTHKNFVDMLHSLRREKEADFNLFFSKMKKSVDSLSRQSINRDILAQAKEGIKGGNDFTTHARVPENYSRYGKFYYYYNQVLLFKLNTIGAGMAYKMNEILGSKEKSALRFLEMPALFKVLYPRKLVHMEAFTSQKRYIDVLPSTLSNRDLTHADNSIQTDKEIVVLELFDHMMLDGDIVSVNFNGDWILKNQSLEKEPVKVKLRLNPEGNNYIILHAENEGIKPPNTMGVSFFENGKKKTVLLTSNMSTSQMMEINIKK